MTIPVESYIAGSWHGPAGPRTELLNASTAEPVAVVGTDPIDMVPVLDHARSVGGPALREMPFHERALALKALAAYLNGKREQFYAISAWTGATHRDSLVDIDGGIGVLFTYASKGRRELPNATVLVDGPVERLGRTGQFVGQHIYTSRRGVALQINAFNFPVWGMLEKLAPAFLAGVPTVVKPASQASYLAEAVVKEIIASGLLPEGSLQLVAGGSRGLLDLLSEQDTVAFTGSASTAALLRSHHSVMQKGVRFSSEADSLNFSVLGIDVQPGSAEFDLYVRQLVTEMTAKAGQKCNAIRRALAYTRGRQRHSGLRSWHEPARPWPARRRSRLAASSPPPPGPPAPEAGRADRRRSGHPRVCRRRGYGCVRIRVRPGVRSR